MAPNSPDLNPVDYKIWGIMQQRVYEMQIHMSANSSGDWLTFGAVCSKVLLTLLCVRVKGGHFEHLLYAVSIAEWNYQ